VSIKFLPNFPALSFGPGGLPAPGIRFFDAYYTETPVVAFQPVADVDADPAVVGFQVLAGEQ